MIYDQQQSPLDSKISQVSLPCQSCKKCSKTQPVSIVKQASDSVQTSLQPCLLGNLLAMIQSKEEQLNNNDLLNKFGHQNTKSTTQLLNELFKGIEPGYKPLPSLAPITKFPSKISYPQSSLIQASPAAYSSTKARRCSLREVTQYYGHNFNPQTSSSQLSSVNKLKRTAQSKDHFQFQQRSLRMQDNSPVPIHKYEPSQADKNQNKNVTVRKLDLSRQTQSLNIKFDQTGEAIVNQSISKVTLGSSMVPLRTNLLEKRAYSQSFGFFNHTQNAYLSGNNTAYQQNEGKQYQSTQKTALFQEPKLSPFNRLTTSNQFNYGSQQNGKDQTNDIAPLNKATSLTFGNRPPALVRDESILSQETCLENCCPSKARQTTSLTQPTDWQALEPDLHTLKRQKTVPGVEQCSMPSTPNSSNYFQNQQQQQLFGAGAGESTQTHKPCNCRKSKCLKLYCECFARGVDCTAACSCVCCHNTAGCEHIRQKARAAILRRNPSAFCQKLVENDPLDKENNNVYAAELLPSAPVHIITPECSDQHSNYQVQLGNNEQSQSDSVRSIQSHSQVLGEKNLNDPTKRHFRGCNCRRSQCQKKYCECFQRGVKCTEFCKCEDCLNGNPHSHHTQMLKRQQYSTGAIVNQNLFVESIAQ